MTVSRDKIVREIAECRAETAVNRGGVTGTDTTVEDSFSREDWLFYVVNYVALARTSGNYRQALLDIAETALGGLEALERKADEEAGEIKHVTARLTAGSIRSELGRLVRQLDEEIDRWAPVGASVDAVDRHSLTLSILCEKRMPEEPATCGAKHSGCELRHTCSLSRGHGGLHLMAVCIWTG